jgi:hypothetical protein
VEIEGRLRAKVTRTCGVSLEPFDEEVDEPVLWRLVPPGSPRLESDESPPLVDPAAPDPPDPLTGEELDLAAFLTESLALALSPYPRKPGAELEVPPPDDDAGHPFAALATWKGG